MIHKPTCTVPFEVNSLAHATEVLSDETTLGASLGSDTAALVEGVGFDDTVAMLGVEDNG